MTEPKFDAGYSDVEDVAETVLEEFAANNGGVVEVVPVDEVETRLDDALLNADQFDEESYQDVLVGVKDEILARDVMIA
jgi:hypothetical protein